MNRNVMKGLLYVILMGLLRGKPIIAQECMENAAVPKPVTVAYETQRKVEFEPGADGVLRARDLASGGELWSYSMPELDATHRADGLMSEARILRFDADLDGVIEPAAGDRVWLYFGMRRGGRHYYALDVTDASRPQELWKAGPDQLPGVGETWSTPTIVRVRIGGASQNGEHFVVIVGGGYDEAPPFAHRIYMLDAASGELLWYGGGPGGIENPVPPDLALPWMTEPIPARIAVLDTDGDRFADRMYAADLGGRIWRFDIWNGRGRSQLVTGGVLAALADATPEDARRFFNAPDVALIQRRGSAPYYNLALGSGDRAHPFDTVVHDRFYSIRDVNPFAKFSQSNYDALVPMTDSTLTGWKRELNDDGAWAGEKVLAEAFTVNGVILFPSYKPISQAACSGENRVYALNVEEGNAVLDLNDDEQLDNSDTSVPLTQSGIASEVALSFPESPTDPGSPDSPDGPPDPEARCTVGAESLRLCVAVPGRMRTFWQRNSTD